jgi:hypothetical protein
MDITGDDGATALNRDARARSRRTGRSVATAVIDDAGPVAWVADEVLVDAADTEAIDRMTALGGRIIRPVRDPELPEEFLRAGLTRRAPLDMTGVPRTVKIRFDRPPETSETEIRASFDRVRTPGDRMRFSSESALRMAALVAPLRAEGRRVSLNQVGDDDRILPLRAPVEGAGHVFTADPLAWGAMGGRFRIADAWQLIETLRMTRSVGGPVFICICDSGFWFDAPTGVAGSPGAQTIADLGLGGPRWNAVDDVAGVPSGPGRTNWHGTSAASAAAAVVGNAAGAAGSGGTVAIPCYFFDDRSADATLTTMIRCTQWGIPFVNFSGAFSSLELFFDTDGWNDTFTWAADNGTLMIASAGNDDEEISDGGIIARRPATLTPRAITVGAVNDDGTKASFSNWGAPVDLWAPGVNIPVTPTGATAMSPSGAFISGTSFSAPIVAGVAAMVRAANPALSVDDVRNILLSSATAGEGVVSRVVDAYAAVWAAMSTRMAETSTEAAPEQLWPRADGTFEPIFNSAINRRVDSDPFLLDVASFSRLSVTVQWYDRLARLDLFIESTEPGAADPDVVVTRGAGTLTVSAEVGSGRYRLTVRGSAPTAYLLSGSLTPGTLAPDRFEGNDSFETATELRVTAPTLHPLWGIDLLLRIHGPGEFPLTLHTRGTGPATTDVDYFHLVVPADIGALKIPHVLLGSDEPLDLTVYDGDRRVRFTQSGSRQAKLPLLRGEEYYLAVTGPRHTRYTLWVGTLLDAEALRRTWQEELKFVIPWWEHEHPDWFLRPEEYRAVILDEPMLQEGVLVFGGAESGVMPDGVTLELQDVAGITVSEATSVAGRRVFDLDGVTPGPYVLRVTSPATHAFALRTESPLGGVRRALGRRFG